MSVLTTVKQASSQVHSFYVIVVASSLRTLIVSFRIVLRSFSCFVIIHRASGVVLSTLLARVFVMRLHTLPEPIFKFARMFPY